MQHGFALFCCALAALLLGCQAQSDSGTNTNWLRQCVLGEECDASDACLCGRCTRECLANADCPTGHVCTGGDSAELQCSGEPTATCQPACASDLECGDARLCHRGACVDALESLACPAEALFCEDFEEALAENTASVVTEGNRVGRVEGRAPSGRFFFSSEVTEAPSTAYLRADLSPSDAKQLTVSGWVRVPEALPHDASPLALWSSRDEDWALRLTLRDAEAQVWSGTSPLTESVPLEPGAWHCLQLRVEIGDGSSGSVALLVDGASLDTAVGVDTLPDGGIEAVAWGNLWAGTPSEVAVDRVIVSTRPVSCFE